MERNNGRYTYLRRQGGGAGQHNNQHHSSSSLSSNSSSTNSYTSNSNNSNTSIYNNSTSSSVSHASREPFTQHDELIRYIREAWTTVKEQGTPIIYCKESDHQLKNFKPFNLEEYWGQRLVQNIHGGGHQ